MKRIFLFAASLLMVASLYAQNIPEGYSISSTNVIYKKLKSNPDGKQVVEGDLVIGRFRVKFNDKTVQETYSQKKSTPTFIATKQNKRFAGDLMDGLFMMRSGEEYSFAFPVDSMRNVQRLPEELKDGFVFYTVVADSVVAYEVFAKAERDRLDSLMLAEKNVIMDYLHENHWSDIHREGIYYKEIVEGQGRLADTSNVVKVHYIGQLLDGTVFDTSIDSVAKANNLYNPKRDYSPLEFQIGAGRMIKGFEIAARQMKKGGKAVVILPSALAYGDRDMGIIKPYSPLMFTMELVDLQEGEPLPVKKSPVIVTPTTKESSSAKTKSNSSKSK